MEDRLVRLRRIDFTWGRTTKKKLNLRREAVPLNQIFSIPEELTLHIISLLHACDVLSLGRCSKSWNKLCNSDSVWKNLYVKRWPADRLNKGKWKDSYLSKEKSVAAKLSEYCRKWSVEEELNACYLEEAMTFLINLKLRFEDTCLLFRRKHGILVNLLGLHYAFVFLRVSTNNLTDALARYNVSKRQVNVCWTVNDTFSCGSYTPLHYSLILSLNEIASTEQAVFYLLQNCPHQVRSIRITPHSLCK
ncbi:hypothetical protein LUZ60_012146 [Juncus effusus]|nr:hypothetical protein LUZ60_012146 [Juncus effusus]